MSDSPTKINSLRRVKPAKDPKGRNPYRGKPIPKGRVEWAIENSMSLKGASRILGVSYNTFKKYAVQYDLFDQNKNIGGRGIPKSGNLKVLILVSLLFNNLAYRAQLLKYDFY